MGAAPAKLHLKEGSLICSATDDAPVVEHICLQAGKELWVVGLCKTEITAAAIGGRADSIHAEDYCCILPSSACRYHLLGYIICRQGALSGSCPQVQECLKQQRRLEQTLWMRRNCVRRLLGAGWDWKS